MTTKLLKCVWGIASTVLFALYLFVFYNLAIVPAILEWSLYGVALALVLSGLLIFAVPAAKRRSFAVLGITFLLIVKAIDSIKNYSFIKEAFALIFIFLLILIVGKLLGRFSIRRYVVVFLVAVILNNSLDLSQAPLWTEFNVKWESPSLYKRFATVDYFPVRLADVDGDGIKEIITQENVKQAEEEKENISETGSKYQILEEENNHYAVYKWNGTTFSQLSPKEYKMALLKKALPFDYLGYPFYESKFKFDPSIGLEHRMEPLLDRAQLVERSANFASFPFEMLRLSQASLETLIRSQQKSDLPPPSSVVAAGNLIPGGPPETVTIDFDLKVWNFGPVKELISTIDKEMVSDIVTSEVIVGDVDNDKIDELLLTSENSRILKLRSDGKWEVLWSNPDALDEKSRFQKFRFEDFAPLGKEKSPQIIALSKSYVRDNPTRYMTGYEYKDGALKQKWRVFTGLINLRAGDLDGDGENELVGYMYRAQRLFVLDKHDLPVVPLIYTVTGLLILLGFGLQRKQRQANPAGGETNG